MLRIPPLNLRLPNLNQLMRDSPILKLPHRLPILVSLETRNDINPENVINAASNESRTTRISY